MATRINMMKLLQEVRGLAELANRRPLSRPPEPLILQFRAEGRKLMAAQRKSIQVNILDLPDIPHPVKITHRHAKAGRNRAVQ
jgi:hypothetical protein